MEEINEVFPLHIDKPNFVCKVHEDNQSCIKMATGTKFSPRTKHIALKYHHFRSHVKKGRINIRYKPSEEQLADILTKPLPNEAFFTLRYMLCGWGYNPTRKGWCWNEAKTTYPLQMTLQYTLCKFIPVIRVSSTRNSANKRQTSRWLFFQQPN